MKLKPKLMYYILLALLGVGVASGIAAYSWASNSLKTDTHTLEVSLAQETIADDHIASLISLRKQYNNLQPVAPKILAALPQTKEQTEISLQLQKLAGNAGMSLPSLNFAGNNSVPTTTSQTIKDGNVLALPINFDLTGTYEQLQAFLQGIERLNRYTTVSSLAITRSDSKAGTLNFTLSVNVYVKP